jgi:putative membrane protein
MSSIEAAPERGTVASIVTRGAIGGVLMGLANLVPGISGGTMLVASGVYTAFIQAVAEITTFRFRFRSLVMLASISAGAVVVIALLAGPVNFLVATHRWIMYSLFIGLTLGGVPIVWRMARPASPAVYVGSASGFAVMALMAFAGTSASGGGSMVMLVVAGIAGASAMILPGVSGAYLLLVLGQYEVILGAIDQLKQGLSGDHALIVTAMAVVVPVGVGVVIGVVGISNLVRWTLRRFDKATLGVLLGLLFGSVVGIWPFQQAVEHGQPRAFYAPSAGQVVVSLVLIVAGLAVTLAIDRLGRRLSSAEREADAHVAPPQGC